MTAPVTAPVTAPMTAPAPAPAPKANMIAIKHKPGPVNNASNPALNSNQVNGTSSDNSQTKPPVNMIQVKKAPGKPAAAAPPAVPAVNKKTEETAPAVKKKVNRIESNSSDSDSSDSDSSSSSSDDETSQPSKSGGDNDKKTDKDKSKPKTGPPGIMQNSSSLMSAGQQGAEEWRIISQEFLTRYQQERSNFFYLSLVKKDIAKKNQDMHKYVLIRNILINNF